MALSAAFAIIAMGSSCSLSSGGGGATANAQPVADESNREYIAATRQDVIESRKAEATVGYGSLVQLPVDAEGVVTWAPAQHSILRTGDVAVEIAGKPVVLVVGDTPLYRPLRLVDRGERDEAGTRLGHLTGQDVAQLQQFLLDEGFDDLGRLHVDEVFGLSTHRAVKEWQISVGHPATGVIDTSQMVFMTSDVLVTAELLVGQSFTHLDVSGAGTVLQIQGSTTLREFFAVGSMVEVVSDSPTTGIVTRSARTRLDSGDVAQSIDISVDGVAADDLGQSVQVIGSVTRASDALTVPVRALLAVSEGGWVVEVRSGIGTEQVAVELIDVIGTTAIVDGIAVGDEVVVPL